MLFWILNTTTKMTKKLHEELENFIRMYKSRNIEFPFMHCVSVSLELHKRFDFLCVFGAYCGKLDNEFRERFSKVKPEAGKYFNSIGHYMSYDPKRGVFIDLTAMQFDKTLPDILIMDKDDPKIAMNWSTKNQNSLFIPYDMHKFKHSKGELKEIAVDDSLKPDYMRDCMLERIMNNVR